MPSETSQATPNRALKPQHLPSWQVMIAGIAALILTVGFSRFAYTPLLPLMLTETDLTKAQGSWLATFNYLGYLSGALMVAAITQPERQYLFYRCCLVISLLSTLCMGLTTEYWLWAMLRILGGMSSVGGLLLASAFVLRWLAGEGLRPRLGRHFIGMGLGIAIPGLLIGLFGQTLQWQLLWQLLALAGLIVMIPAWLWMPVPVKPISATMVVSQQTSGADLKWLQQMLLAYFCAGFAFAVSTTFIVVELETLPQFQQQGGWIWLIVGLACAMAAVSWDWLALQLNLYRATAFAYGLHFLAMLLPLLSEQAFWHGVGAVLFGVSFIGIVSLMLTLVGQKFSQQSAKAMGKLTLSYGAAQIFAPLLAGFLVQWTGNFRVMMAISAVFLLLGLCLIIRLLLTEEAINHSG
jgi:predicted MFS family arabinose efflux permease